MESPQWGNRTCQLCADGSYPEDLSFYVGNYTTCGDVHLKMATLRDSRAECPAMQEQYRGLCCAGEGSLFPTLPDGMGKSMVVVAGAVIFGAFARRLISARRTRTKQNNKTLPQTFDEADATSYKRMNDRPGKTPSRKGRSPSRSKGYSPSRKASRLANRTSKSPARKGKSPARNGRSPARSKSARRERDGDRLNVSPLRGGYSPS